MKPRIKLAEAQTPDGSTIALYTHDGNVSMSLNGRELMHSRATASERLMGTVGLAGHQPGQSLRVLIGGLGLGFTLAAVLEGSGADSVVEVVELLPEVISWNREHLRDLNGRLLEDPRVKVVADDVYAVIRAAGNVSYDVILLDIDNGPIAMVNQSNRQLYSSAGIKAVRQALSPGGRAIFWSAGPDQAFANRLKQSGFRVQAIPAKVHEGARRPAYMLYVADRISMRKPFTAPSAE